MWVSCVVSQAVTLDPLAFVQGLVKVKGTENISRFGAHLLMGGSAVRKSTVREFERRLEGTIYFLLSDPSDYDVETLKRTTRPSVFIPSMDNDPHALRIGPVAGIEEIMRNFYICNVRLI